MEKLRIDTDYLWNVLIALLEVPSPTGYTDAIVHKVGSLLDDLEIPFDVTRRGAIRAHLAGESSDPSRAVVAHLDTLGLMVRGLKDNGRLSLAPIGTWSSRFAEGARVSIFSGEATHRGTILPLKASGHVFDEEIDHQPVSWDHVEARIDRPVYCAQDLEAVGVSVGDFIAIDPNPELTEDGYIVSRYLDDKAGVAATFAAAKTILDHGATLPLGVNILFTISEEVGSGASAVLHGDVAEMVSVDNATPAPGQTSIERGATVAMMDSTGPFDYHLTHRLLDLSSEFDIEHARDIFRHYRCDTASAVEAGNDLRTALVGFGVDASHGYERAHIDSLSAVSQLIALYLQSPLTVPRDRRELAPLGDFPEQPSSPPPSEPVVPDELPADKEG
jgi:peptidase M42 family hydrolase